PTTQLLPGLLGQPCPLSVSVPKSTPVPVLPPVWAMSTTSPLGPMEEPAACATDAIRPTPSPWTKVDSVAPWGAVRVNWVVVAVMPVPADQWLTKFAMLTEPRPVTWSKPVPALKPGSFPLTQPELPDSQGTALLPVVVSRKMQLAREAAVPVAELHAVQFS